MDNKKYYIGNGNKTKVTDFKNLEVDGGQIKEPIDHPNPKVRKLELDVSKKKCRFVIALHL
jgi:hypothetical protein